MKRKAALDTILNDTGSIEDKLQNICDYLYQNVPYYNWVGFYFNNGDLPELKLGPYAGTSTEHTIIPFGKGICGQVAESNENFIVPNVEKEDNYLACSIETKAEVVIPIFIKGKNIGQIDIDSHYYNPFSPEDIQELEYICQEVASLLS